jgi:hypothetical protein
MMSERIVRNARELKLLGLAENLDELVKRGEEEDLGYREFLDLQAWRKRSGSWRAASTPRA